MSDANFTADELIQAINESLNQPRRHGAIIYTHGDVINAITAGRQVERDYIIRLLEIHYPGRLAGVKALIKGEK